MYDDMFQTVRPPPRARRPLAPPPALPGLARLSQTSSPPPRPALSTFRQPELLLRPRQDLAPPPPQVHRGGWMISSRFTHTHRECCI